LGRGATTYQAKAREVVTKSLRIHRLAEDELADAAVWYETRQPGLGIALLDLIDKAVETISYGLLPTSPVPGVKKINSARRILLRRYPYSIVIHESKDEIVIVAFAHNSRRPGYWLERLNEKL
jgi:plasmid stabilization system protein ParE